jgi:hypothetical protein
MIRKRSRVERQLVERDHDQDIARSISSSARDGAGDIFYARTAAAST